MTGATSPGGWLTEVRTLVDARLRSHFAEKQRRAGELGPDALSLVGAIEALTMRGGKRLRPALAFAAHRAVVKSAGRDEDEGSDLIAAGAALELLQSYLLIHDDWMDGAEERRGGPAVHAALSHAHGEDAHLGASLAVLAGNLASAHAWELLTSVRGPEPRLRAVLDVFHALHEEVAFGQQLDLLGAGRIEVVQQLKTGSYTVRGPLLLGAALGGAGEAQRRALAAFGEPLGEAFQTRDDLLGTFGDRSALGKPVGGDLRAGKRTALVRAAEELAPSGELVALRAVLGRADASDTQVAAAVLELRRSGAKDALEARTNGLVERAKSALERAPLEAAGVAMLHELADGLALRDR